MTTVRMTFAGFWEQHAGGLLPYTHFERTIGMSGGTQYHACLTWGRRMIRFEYDRPGLPRSVRRPRAAEDAGLAEKTRRADAAEPLVQAGDVIPPGSYGLLARCAEVRTGDYRIWKRAEGDERTCRGCEDDCTDQQYDWISWCAGHKTWSCGWSTSKGLIANAPITVLKVADHAAF